MIYIELEPSTGGPLESSLLSLVDSLLTASPTRTVDSMQEPALYGAYDPSAETLPELTAETPLDPLDEQPLLELFRELLSQHLEPIAGFIRMIRRGPHSREVLDGFRNYLAPLLQLTVAMEQRDAQEVLGRFLAHIGLLERHSGNLTYKELEPFNLCFDLLLSCVGTELRERYLSICFYQRNSNPLLEEIRRIKFMGPRRLQRLYTVGLVTVEALAGARPQELTEVTGLPTKLAEQVIDVANQFRSQQRDNRRRALRTLCQDLREELNVLTATDVGLLDGLESELEETLATLQRARAYLPPRDSSHGPQH